MALELAIGDNTMQIDMDLYRIIGRQLVELEAQKQVIASLEEQLRKYQERENAEGRKPQE